MSPPRTLRQVNAALATLEGRRIRRMRRSYGRAIAAPTASAIRGARSNDDLLRRLGADLYRRMDDRAVQESLADQVVQAALIGRTAARPVGKGSVGR